MEKLIPFDIASEEFISRDLNKKGKDYLSKLVEKLNEIVDYINGGDL